MRWRPRRRATGRCTAHRNRETRPFTSRRPRVSQPSNNGLKAAEEFLVQGSAKKQSPGCMNAACKARQKSWATAGTKCTKPGDRLLTEPCTCPLLIKEYLSPFQKTNKPTSRVNRRPKQPRADLRREESPLAAAVLPKQPAAGGVPPAQTLSPATTLSTSTSRRRRRRVPSAPGPTSARGRRTSPGVAHFTSLFSAYYILHEATRSIMNHIY